MHQHKTQLQCSLTLSRLHCSPHLFFQKIIRTNYGKFNIRYFGSKIWNDIEVLLKTLSFHSFKRKLKEHFLDNNIWGCLKGHSMSNHQDHDTHPSQILIKMVSNGGINEIWKQAKFHSNILIGSWDIGFSIFALVFLYSAILDFWLVNMYGISPILSSHLISKSWKLAVYHFQAWGIQIWCQKYH